MVLAIETDQSKTIYSQVVLFANEHKILCIFTLGLAIAACSLYKLSEKAILWIRGCFSDTIQTTDALAQERLMPRDTSGGLTLSVESEIPAAEEPFKENANFILTFRVDFEEGPFNLKRNYLLIKNKCIEAQLQNLVFDDEKSIIYVCGSVQDISQLRIELSGRFGEMCGRFFDIECVPYVTLKGWLSVIPHKRRELLRKAIPQNEAEIKNIIVQLPKDMFSREPSAVHRKLMHLKNLLRLHYHTHYDIGVMERLFKESGWEGSSLTCMLYEIEKPYLFKVHSAYQLNEYLPASDIFAKFLTDDERKEFHDRSSFFRDKIPQEKSEVEALRNAIPECFAHGIETEKGGLLNMLNFLLEGDLKEIQFGAIGSSDQHDTQMLSGSHGPFFIIPSYKQGRGLVIRACLVPLARDKELLFLALDRAVEHRFLSREEGQALKGKIHTHQEVYSSPSLVSFG
ncbi:MAG: hypothetical protein WC371_02990 [Parachlamydiales bacterium]|jgi:hypothetical protein